MNRRDFLKSSAVAALASSLPMPNLRAQNAARGMIDPARMTIGTTVKPVELFTIGIPEMLDRMRELAGVNTVMTFTHTHVGRQYNRFQPPRDDEGNLLPETWVRTNPALYANPSLQGLSPGAKWADRDVLDELHAEAEPRNMTVYARILEPYVVTGAIPGFENWREVDALGGQNDHVCFNHPEYIEYWESVVTDLVRGHPYLDGFKYGQERGGPLLSTFGTDAAAPGKCFCEHCTRLAEEKGLNVENARQGLIAAHQYARSIRAGERPIDGNHVGFLRLLIQYPMILPWEQFWMDNRERQRKRMYSLIKRINPRIQVGWHKDHGQTWDLITRATSDYSKMGPYTDWITVALYFGSMGRRSLQHFDKNYRDILFGDANENDACRMYLSMLGYDPDKQPSIATQRAQHPLHFDPEYVYTETRRVVRNLAGTAKVWARIGFDHPGYDSREGPEEVREAVNLAWDAGADGFFVGREWDELAEENIIAFGEALRGRLG